LDPEAFLVSASNTSETTGGADAESDDELRVRVKLAPSQFSVAGPKDAYKFFAKSASAAIIDVAVTSTVPGTVNIYPLIEGEIETPTEILDLVFDVCNDDKVRPLTDTVVVESPTFVDYDIEIEITILSDADSVAVQAAAQTAVEAYRDERAKKLGADIVVSKLNAAAFVDSSAIYSVSVIEPAADVVLDETEVGKCGSILVTVTGENDG
jgi:phage-related baseplate assembly protein